MIEWLHWLARNCLFYKDFSAFRPLGTPLAFRFYISGFSSFSKRFPMTHFFHICRFVVVLSLVPIFSGLGGETVQELPGKALEASTGSTGSHIFEGKLLNND